MKNFKNLFLLILAALLIMSANAFSQDTAVVSTDSTSFLDGIIAFISDNWGVIAGILTYILYRLIPTGKADVIMKVISWLISLIPDNKKGGGKYKIKIE